MDAGAERRANDRGQIMTCSQCTEQATRLVSPDMDIGGIPLCDNPDCYIKLVAQLLDYGDEFGEPPKQ